MISILFPYKHKLSHKEIAELIRRLTEKYKVPVPEWRIAGERSRKEKGEKPKFGPVTTFETKMIDVSGAFFSGV